MNKKNLISVIIPAYNCQNVIEKCIYSLEKQTYKNFEVIVINDGSKDNTEKIIENKIKENKIKIKLISQKNVGPGRTRNRGIEASSGEFITFVDADDELNENFLKKMHEYINKFNVQIVRCNYKIKKNNKSISSGVDYNSGIINRDDLIRDYLFDNVIWNSVWGQLIRKESIGNTKFEDYRIGEDLLFNFYLYKNINSVYYTEEVLYYYNFNENGITKKLEEKNIKANLEDNIKYNEKIYNELNDNKIKKKIVNRCINMIISYQLQLVYLNQKSIKLKEFFENPKISKLIDEYNGEKYRWLVYNIKKKRYYILKAYCILYYIPLKKIKECLKKILKMVKQ